MSASGPPTTDPGPARRVPRPWWWWCAWAALAITLAVVAARAHRTSDLTRTLPSNDPELNRSLDFFLPPPTGTARDANDSARLLAIEGATGPGADAQQVQDAMQRLLQALAPYGASPVPDPGAEGIARLITVVEDHLPELADASALARIRERIQPDALAPYLAALRARAADPGDLLTGSFTRSDVLAIGPELMRTLIPTTGIGFANGVVSHPDGVHFLLPLTVDFDPGDMKRTYALMEAVDAQVALAKAQGITLEPIGSYRHFDDNMRTLTADFFATIPVGVALILAVLWSLARAWPAVGAMYLPALLGLAAAVSAVALTDGEVPLPLIGFAASLLGVAVDYGIQMTYALRAGEVGPVKRPLLRSFLLSSCAFAALATSSVPALHALGLMVLCGVGMAYFAARWLLPSVVAPSHVVDPWRSISLPLLHMCERRRWFLLAVAALATALCLPGLGRLAFITDLQKMDGSRPATRAALHAFLDRWGSLEATNYLVTSSDTLDHALGTLAWARARMGLPPSVIDRALPDRAAQERHRLAWNAFWTEHGERFAQDFAAACAQVHLKAQGFAPSLERYRASASPDPVAAKDWAGTPIGAWLDKLVVARGAQLRVATPIDVKDSMKEMPAIDARAKTIDIDPVWIASRTHLASRLVEVLRADLARRGLLILLAVGTAVTLLVRRPRIILAMLIPPGVALVWTFGLMGWCQVELTPFTVLVAAFVGGIGIDCAVFLAQAEHRRSLVTPVIGCIATAVAGTAVMHYARHPLLSGVGTMLTIGMIACLIASLMITPAIAGPCAHVGPRKD